MVPAQINIAIVAHPSRMDIARQLYREIDADDRDRCLCNDMRIFIDNNGDGALKTHTRALLWASTTRLPTVILEDDAEPVVGFSKKVVEIIGRHAGSPISFYLGTGRPPQYQDVIREAVESGADYLRLPTLIHGVSYYVPAELLRGNISRIRIDDTLPADYAIGKMVGRDFIYPLPSLADHLDGESVENHKDGEKRTEKRKAWKLSGKTIRKAETFIAKG
ncbi:MAG: hypothetical protein [Bacteriophage sp.]|nr:MAG: hypothetical protein [Bacteriophage sp.]